MIETVGQLINALEQFDSNETISAFCNDTAEEFQISDVSKVGEEVVLELSEG